jgi:RNA polymerase sigma-70 factor (ECF subfamily)
MVRRHQAGDPDAFAEIYRTHYVTIVKFAYFRVKDRPLAEDIAQATFAKALPRLASFEVRDRAVGAWLVTIARNLVADYYKSGRYRLEVTTGDVLDAGRDDKSPEGNPESAVVDYLTNLDLLAALKQITPEQQECIVLRFLRGLSVAETARAMDKNEGAIKALQHRATQALARVMREQDQQWQATQLMGVAL